MPLSVPEGEGKHAAKLMQAPLTPVPIGFEDHLGVGIAAKVQSRLLELRANLAEVVDLSVVDDPVAGCGIVHGLMPLRRQVQDCEAPISQTDFIGFPRRVTQNDRAAVVRPTMREGSGGALQHLGRNTRMMRNDAKDSAHSLSCTMIA